MLKIKLEELEIFEAVIKNGNFSSAADKLGITSSVVSRTIKKLENKLATTLFNRTTRKIYLTQEGEWLYNNITDMVTRAHDVESFLRDKHRKPQGILTIDAASPFVLHALCPLISGYKTLYPDVIINLQSSESNIDLIDRKVDMAIRIGELEDSSLKAKKLGESFRMLYASKGYISQNGQPETISQLKHHSCLGFTQPQKLNSWPLAGSDGEMLKIIPDVFADNGETLKQLAINDSGIACLSSFTVKEDVLAGRLTPILEDKVVRLPIPIYAVFYSDNQMNNRLRSFLDYMSENIRLK